MNSSPAQRRAFVFTNHLGWVAFCVDYELITDLSFAWKTKKQILAVVKKWEADISTPNSLESRWIERLNQYGTNPDSFQDLPLQIAAKTEFQQNVLNSCRTISPGETLTYGQLAEKAGSPRAARAVGSVMARNRIPLLIPCHRVLRSGGKLGGFSAPQGVSMKAHLLQLEQLEPVAQ